MEFEGQQLIFLLSSPFPWQNISSVSLSIHWRNFDNTLYQSLANYLEKKCQNMLLLVLQLKAQKDNDQEEMSKNQWLWTTM